MNLRNKRLVMSVRTLFGLLLIFSGAVGLLSGSHPEGTPENMIAITQTLWDSGLIQMIKATELIAGIMLVANFLPALAVIFVAPIAVGIIVINAMLMPAYTFVGVIFALIVAYLGYAYWPAYQPLFSRN